jgi:MoxR-like ATPase
MSSEIALAVRVARATGRPLLLRGDPGSGKSSLAAHVARSLNWRYYEHVVTSRTQTTDLLWTFDAVRRLADAQALERGKHIGIHGYVEPGALWWAFDRESALRRGRSADPQRQISDQPAEPNAKLNKQRSATDSVVLIDEIDKADPDTPNGLLVPLGSAEFTVAETGDKIRAATPGAERLIIITTNDERALPQAFLRRCVVLWLEAPEGEELVDIAKAHLAAYDGPVKPADVDLARALAREMDGLREAAARDAVRAPSTAEYLDALRACRNLHITVGSRQWAQLRDLVLIKPQQSPRRRGQ